MKHIATVTVGSSGPSAISILNIPQGYSDLVIYCTLKSTTGNYYDDVSVYLNNNTSGSAAKSLGIASGTTFSHSNSNALNFRAAAAWASSLIYGSAEIYIPDYSVNKTKTVLIHYSQEHYAANAHMGVTAVTSSETAPITGITIQTPSSFMANSSISIYGIIKGSGKATIS